MKYPASIPTMPFTTVSRRRNGWVTDLILWMTARSRTTQAVLDRLPQNPMMSSGMTGKERLALRRVLRPAGIARTRAAQI